jgi:putative DNA primase/helicase
VFSSWRAPLDVAGEIFEDLAPGRPGARLVYWRDDFYHWRGVSGWSVIAAERIEREIMLTLGSAYTESKSGELVPWRPDRGKVAGVAHALQALSQYPRNYWEPLPDAPYWLGSAYEGRANPEGRIVAVANGLYSLGEEQLLPPTPYYFTLRQSPIAYEPEASCPRFDEWLAGRFPGDADSQLLAWQILAAVVAGRWEDQRIFALVGATRAGKSTFIRILTALAGVRRIGTISSRSLTGTFGLEPLVGKSVLLLNDLHLDPRNGPLFAETINSISGGDSQSWDRKHKPAWEGYPRMVVIYHANEPPSVADSAQAFAARQVALWWRDSFEGSEDPSIEVAIMGELPGILLGALRTARDMEAEPLGGYVRPEASGVLIRQIRDDSSPVAGFARERLAAVPGSAGVILPELRDAYENYCSDTRSEPVGERILVRSLQALFAGSTVARRRIGGVWARRLLGVELVPHIAD